MFTFGLPVLKRTNTSNTQYILLDYLIIHAINVFNGHSQLEIGKLRLFALVVRLKLKGGASGGDFRKVKRALYLVPVSKDLQDNDITSVYYYFFINRFFHPSAFSKYFIKKWLLESRLEVESPDNHQSESQNLCHAAFLSAKKHLTGLLIKMPLSANNA